MSERHFVFFLFWMQIQIFLRKIDVSEFRAGRSPILIATDVAARGLGKSAVTLIPAAPTCKTPDD
jgi:superfamily II DNA/RNA helicase